MHALKRIVAAAGVLWMALLLISLPACEKESPKSGSDATGGAVKKAEPAAEDKADCDIQLVSETAREPIAVKWKSDTEVEYAKVHTGRILTPAGVYIKDIGTMPTGADLSPDGKYLAVVCSGGKDWSNAGSENNQSIRIVSTADQAVVKTIEEPEAFLGVAFSQDGKRLYVSGGISDDIYIYDVQQDFKRLHTLHLEGYPFGLAVTNDSKSLLVAISHRTEIYQIDTETLQTVMKFKTLTYPYQVIVDDADEFAYVSNIGNDAISVLDLNNGTTKGHVSVGKNPEGLALYGGKLYVADNDVDSISVVDPAKLEVVETIDLRESGLDYPGMLPVDLTVDENAGRLYVTLAGDNAVAVVDLETHAVLGRIPAAFYPTDVEAGNGELYITNAKGVGSGPFEGHGEGPFMDDTMDADGASVGLFYGGVNIVDIPDADTLAAYSEQVRNNNQGALTYFHSDCETWNSPIPTQIGQRSKQIRHVVYIVKENKTYDVLLGDLAGEQGDKWHDPDLAYLGVNRPIARHGADYGPEERFDITPNAHALATTWVDMVNFYDNSVKSTEGHMWLTGGWLNDFGEKFSLLWQVRGERNFMLPNVDPVSTPSTGTLFSHLLEHDRSIRVYGEFVGTAGELFGDAFDYVSHQYQVGITVYDDSEKVKVFKKELDAGIFREFTYIWIPNDHTFGMKEGVPHPAYSVADNDEALGKLVDWISHSPFWESTVIFVLQDDPQNTPDHIDTHRSILHVISPWVKRGHTCELQYDMTAMHRTMHQILGVPPISRYEALQQPMYDLFTLEPDFTPYDHSPHDEKFNDKREWINPNFDELTGKSAKLDFGRVDDQPGLGYILWRTFKGDAPYPAHLISDARDDDDEDEAMLDPPVKATEAAPAAVKPALKGGK